MEWWQAVVLGLVDTGSKVAAGAGRTVTVICLPEQRLCSLMP